MNSTTKPRVFVSYSWDSDSHIENVKRFVQDLRSSGINVGYDGDLGLGSRTQLFMEKSISESDIVLFICTPNYKKRADNRIAGVGYENNVITSELYETCNEEKFIPVLFSGTWKTSLPIWAKGKVGINLSSRSIYKSEYHKLLSNLRNNSFDSTVAFRNGITKKKRSSGKLEKLVWTIIPALITIFTFAVGKNLPDIINLLSAEQELTKESNNSRDVPVQLGGIGFENQPSKSNQEIMSETSYLERLANDIGLEKHIFYSHYNDFNSDGDCELFALVTSKEWYENYRATYGRVDDVEGELWFVNQTGTQMIEKELIYNSCPELFLIKDVTFLNIHRSVNGPIILWGVDENGNPYQPNISGKGYGISVNGNHEIELICSTFDASYSAGELAGHTWKPYYFYLDEVRFKEYGGIKISIDELCAVRGAEESLAEIYNELISYYKIVQTREIYYRGNGIVNINYRCMDSDSEDDYTNCNATLRYTDGKFSVVDSEFGLHNLGSYDAALVPAIAVYPTEFNPISYKDKL